MNVLKANINYYRTVANKTIQQISEQLGITCVTFRRKCENKSFTIRELEIMARFLRISAIDLLKGVVK